MKNSNSEIQKLLSQVASKNLDEALYPMAVLDLLDTKTLIEVLDDAEPSAQREIILILMSRGGDEVVEPIIRMLNSPNYTVRWHAVERLGYLGDKRAVEPILKLLRRSYAEKEWLKYPDDVIHLRLTILSALMKLDDERAIPELQWIAENDTLFHSKGYGMADSASNVLRRMRKEVP